MKWPIKIQTKRQPKVFHRILIAQDVEYLRCYNDMKGWARVLNKLLNRRVILLSKFERFYGIIVSYHYNPIRNMIGIVIIYWGCLVLTAGRRGM